MREEHDALDNNDQHMEHETNAAEHAAHENHDAGIHLHEHQHDGITHKHVHYHPAPHEPQEPETVHGHTHTYAFELYAYADSILHRLDARTKMIAFIVFILAIVMTPMASTWRFGLFLTFIIVLYRLSRVPFIKFGLKRSLVVEPVVIIATLFLAFMPNKPHPAAYDLGFTTLAISNGGFYIFVNAIIKSWLSVLVAILLYSTTPFPKFIKGLELMRMPQILTMLFSFLYRFMWVLTDEIKRMMRARDARAFGGGRLWHVHIIGQMVGSLFIRSYERAERIYAAMAARGYDGTIKSFDTPALTVRDAAFSLFFFTALFAILIWRF
ncbi:MAG TPA: cobalt ECF transporter T component CbiQ [Candidatus Aquicultor sp.]